MDREFHNLHKEHYHLWFNNLLNQLNYKWMSKGKKNNTFRYQLIQFGLV